MDGERFDQAVKAFSGSRRRLLRALGTIPLAGALTALLGEESEAGRQHRRSVQNRRSSGDDKDNRKNGGKGGSNRDSNCKQNGQICGLLAGNCCGDLTCTASIALAVSSCQFACSSDEQCHQKYPQYLTSCEADAAVCPFLDKCCSREVCTNDSKCPAGYTCVHQACRKKN